MDEVAPERVASRRESETGFFDPPRPWWVLASLPIDFLTWAGLLYAGVRARMPSLYVAAGVYFVLMAVGLALAGEFPEDSTMDAVSGTLIVLTWFSGIGVSLAFAPAWQRRLRSGRLAAERRLADRRQAQRLARENPELAREVGVEHSGLVDVNSAPLHAIAWLPGIDDALAAEIVRAREEIDGFSSLADLGTVLRLPGDVVEDLRDRVVFLPR